jgi:hypothetical protein
MALSELNCVTASKPVLFIVTAVRTSSQINRGVKIIFRKTTLLDYIVFDKFKPVVHP